MITPRDDSNVFPVTEAQLTGNYFETLTYGMYLVTCCFCARTLFWIPVAGGEERLRRTSEIRWMLVSVFCFIFVVQTFDDIIGLWHNLVAFVKYKGPGGALKDFQNLHDWINIARSFAQTANMIVGDFVLIYRCFIVHGRRWLVIVPSFILYLTGIAMAVKLMVVEITVTNAAQTLNSSVIEPWWCAFFAITAAQNVLTTSLLVWRIWRVEHQNARYRGTGARSASITPIPQPRLRKVIRVVAESGLAYSTLVFMTFVVSVCNSNALYPMSDATLQATGITFNVIIVRSTPRRDEQFTTFDQTERGTVVTSEASGGGRGFSKLQFVSHPASNQSKTIDNSGVHVTIKSTTDADRLEDGDSHVETYSMQKVGAQ
ncbi:hypothetical protein MVEN_01365000 [Mycena venus]|uniref:Uncharacterized protein n=1 Tax=Mycena venus TaxID=2733690 RepID=A0A8H7CUA6_9AGAR|nr:hypothetical protein MVEN_01365000 [Mycena venus]